MSDTHLHARLTASLAVHPSAPSDAEVAAVRALVTPPERGGVVAPLVPAPPVHKPLRTLLVAAACVLALLVGGGTVALATGSSLPSALRAPARALGLPVDSAAVARTRSAMADLRAALAGSDDGRVARARDELARRFDVLKGDDRRSVVAEVTSLLRQADARLAPRPPTTAPNEVLPAPAPPPTPQGEQASPPSSEETAAPSAESPTINGSEPQLGSIAPDGESGGSEPVTTPSTTQPREPETGDGSPGE